MHYTPIDMNEARSLLGGIDGDVPVTLTPGVQLQAKAPIPRSAIPA